MRKKKLTPVEHEKEMNAYEIRNCEKAIVDGILTVPPKRRAYKVHYRVQWGNHKETYIREVYQNGMYYLTETIGVIRERNGIPKNELHILKWTDLLPFQAHIATSFAKEEKVYLRMLNSPLSSLISMVQANHVGVDMDVDYQREHVWTKADKIALIDSIFNNIEIGKFVFVQRDMRVNGKLYEILDGKQRLTAITEFVEDRLKYKGFYFSELSYHDQYKFTDCNVSYGYLENPDKRAIFETFIKLNTCGKPMANKHINHVRQLLSEL